MTKSKEVAAKIVGACEQYGWTFEVKGTILKIHKNFEPEDMDALVRADMEYYSILELLPMTAPGSVWGTDCGGIGAYSALKSGVFTMNKSGGSKQVLNALKQKG